MLVRSPIIAVILSSISVSVDAQQWGDEAVASTSARSGSFPASSQSQQVCNGTNASLCLSGYPTTTGDGNRASVSLSSTSGSATSRASAYANMSTAKMGLTASANGPLRDDLNGAFAQALMQDTLHFIVTGSTPVTVGVQLTIDGSILGTSGFSGDLQSSLGLTNTAGAGTNLIEGVAFDDPRAVQDSLLSLSGASIRDLGQTGNWAQYAAGNGAGVIFTGTITVDPLHPDYTLYETFVGSVNSQYRPVSIQAADTAALNFILPDGVTFTSASGELLTTLDSAVPEPATWSMMLFGFAAIGFAMRRERSEARAV